MPRRIAPASCRHLGGDVRLLASPRFAPETLNPKPQTLYVAPPALLRLAGVRNDILVCARTSIDEPRHVDLHACGMSFTHASTCRMHVNQHQHVLA